MARASMTDVFGVIFNDGSNPNFRIPESATGGRMEEVYVRQLQGHYLVNPHRRACGSRT